MPCSLVIAIACVLFLVLAVLIYFLGVVVSSGRYRCAQGTDVSVLRDHDRVLEGGSQFSVVPTGCTRDDEVADLAPSQTKSYSSASNRTTATVAWRVLSWNIMAPCWTSPDSYPASCVDLLDTDLRRQRVIAFLQQQHDAYDLFCLQEVQESEYDQLALALVTVGFVGYVVYHDRDYWSAWRTSNTTAWERNGVAVFCKARTIQMVSAHDTPLTRSGNHCLVMQMVHTLHQELPPLRLTCLHLDADDEDVRGREALELLRILGSCPDGTIDLLAGDFNLNFSTKTYHYIDIFQHTEFRDCLHAVGHSVPTHPFLDTVSSTPDDAVLDHLMVRDGVTRSATVFDFGLWTTFPDDQDARVHAALEACGSDHFPIAASIAAFL